MILPKFSKRLHESEKILGHGGRAGSAPLRSATDSVTKFEICFKKGTIGAKPARNITLVGQYNVQ